jgi:hypothetical protein
MYRVGNRKRSHRKRTVWVVSILFCLLIIVIGGSIIAKQTLKPDTVIKQSAAVVSVVSVAKQATQTFDSGIFTIQLPKGWQAVAGEKQPYNIFRFEGGIGTPDEQLLEIYQDTIPQNFAVNEVLAVSSAGARLAPIGVASDNCADFTKSTSAVAGPGGTPAKWSGMNFLCDLSNTERGVVGTSSLGGINTVTLKGPTAGAHAFFFCYTDTSIAPDYTAFYNALGSFRLK